MLQPAWPSAHDFFLGEWEDDEGSQVSVGVHGPSVRAILRKEDVKERRLSIHVDEFGRWKCGEGILQPHKSNKTRILWWSDRHWRCPSLDLVANLASFFPVFFG